MTDWRPGIDAAMLRRRAELLERIRRFFRDRGVLEVTTPLLTACGVTDVHIDSVATDHPPGWLRSSPEYYHKRLLAAGTGDLYEMGPVFRRGEAGCRHQPEFTLLEWYRVGRGWRALAGETVELVRTSIFDGDDTVPVREISWRQCFVEHFGIDPFSTGETDLAALAGDAPAGLERDALLDWLFAGHIQPAFPDGRITVVFDYPASQAALARLKPGDARVAERFEVFFGDLELANGYHELADADEQRRRFERDNALRAQLGRKPMPIDESLLAALAAGLPDCSGVALGVDRLLMAASGSGAIDRVLPFVHRSGE